MTNDDQGDGVSEEVRKTLQQLESCFQGNEVNFHCLIEIFPFQYSGFHGDPIFVKLILLINGSSLFPGTTVSSIMVQYGTKVKCKYNIPLRLS